MLDLEAVAVLVFRMVLLQIQESYVLQKVVSQASPIPFCSADRFGWLARLCSR